MIKFDKVYVKFVNDFYSLFDLSCEINSHSFLIENNLCGSSAFMRTLSKINNDYKGEIFVDDVNLKNIKDKDLSIAYLPENPILFKNKSIKFNLSYPLKIRKIDKNIIQKEINQLDLEFNNLNFNQKIKKLNLSEQKIITLLRILIRKPKYVLIENLFENIDENYKSTIIFILEKLKENSIIIATEKNKENFKYYENYVKLEI